MNHLKSNCWGKELKLINTNTNTHTHTHTLAKFNIARSLPICHSNYFLVNLLFSTITHNEQQINLLCLLCFLYLIPMIKDQEMCSSLLYVCVC